MVNVRRSILQQLKRTGRTRYWLAQKVEKHLTSPAVYQYLGGKSDMIGKNIEILLTALDLEIRPKDRS
jgi:hypothetical protein